MCDLLQLGEPVVGAIKGNPMQGYSRFHGSIVYYPTFHCLNYCTKAVLHSSLKCNLQQGAYTVFQNNVSSISTLGMQFFIL